MVPKNKKERVFEYLKKHPTISMAGIYFEFPNMNRSTLRQYKREWKRLGNVTKVIGALRTIFNVFRYKVKLIHQLNIEEKMAFTTLEDFLKDV